MNFLDFATANARAQAASPELLRYAGRVKTADGKLSGEFLDWFTDDDDARASYRAIMAEQGYAVRTVTIQGQNAIVEVY